MENVIVYEKVTTWLKHTIQVDNVRSRQEAIDVVIDYYKGENEPPYEDDLYTVTTEELCECEETLTPEENGGHSTIEITDNNKVVWNNGTVC